MRWGLCFEATRRAYYGKIDRNLTTVKKHLKDMRFAQFFQFRSASVSNVGLAMKTGTKGRGLDRTPLSRGIGP